MKKLISILLVLVMALSLFTACGEGPAGLNGKDGIDGKDGISPQVRIGSDNYWQVSYDDGATWQSLGVKATGADGADGVKGETGDKGVAGDKGKRGEKGEDGESCYVWVKYADTVPTSDADLKDTLSAYMGIYSGNSETAPTDYTAYQWIQIAPTGQEAEPIPEPDTDFTVLSIGNSFMNIENTMSYIYQMAQAQGKTNIKLGNMYAGGVSMSYAYNDLKNNTSKFAYYENTNGTWNKTSTNYSMRAAVEERDWDYILIHQHNPLSGKAENFKDLSAYISLIKELCPKAKIMFVMSWTYPQGGISNSFADYNNDPQVMYDAIVNVIQTEVLPLGVEVIPAGTAIANARASGVAEEMITYDSFKNSGTGHLTNPGETETFGRYLVSLTVISKITGMSIDNISFTSKKLTAEQKALAIACVNSAINNPYTITTCSAN